MIALSSFTWLACMLPMLRSNKYTLLVAFALASVLCAPGLALAADESVDLSGVYSRLDLIYEQDGIVSGDVFTMQQDVAGIRDDLSALSDSLSGIREALESDTDDVATYTLDADSSKRIDTLVSELKRINDARDAATKADRESAEPYMTLDGIGQLLMINTGCLAVIIGMMAFKEIWHVLGGGR